MNLSLRDSLPFVSATISYRGAAVNIDNVLIDTGSATSIFSADRVARVQIIPLPNNTLHIIRGVGGSEAVFSRRIDYLQIDGYSILDFEIEVGGMDYGFQIDGILGMDFLMAASAVIDLGSLTVRVGHDEELA